MFDGRPVTVMDMADARERRVQRRERLQKIGETMISFSLNIPGEIKDAPILRRTFMEGEQLLREILPLTFAKRWEEFTGWEGIYLCQLPPEKVKRETALLEETHPLGRLFDFDVFSADGSKLSRPQYRKCLLCGGQVQLCARSRVHPLAELTAAVEKIAVDYFDAKDTEKIGLLAEQALLFEVSVTPKPGLVDRNNNGSHKDMELWTFLKSASSLRETFVRCAKAGMEEEKPVSLFYRLRQLGICGEVEMRRSTGGVNTHKGAIFSLGLLCGAWGHHLRYRTEPLETIKEMSAVFLQDEQVSAGGFGSKLYQKRQCGGIRQEAALGYPTVMQTGLPVFRQALQRGFTENDAGVWALLKMIAQTADTNMICRVGFQKAEELRACVSRNCTSFSSAKELLQAALDFDRIFISENASPGGCADLLAVTWFFNHIAEDLSDALAAF